MIIFINIIILLTSLGFVIYIIRKGPNGLLMTINEKLREITLTFLFAIPGIWISMMIMTWLENLGPSWAYDIAGTISLLTGIILWYTYTRWRRWALKLN